MLKELTEALEKAEKEILAFIEDIYLLEHDTAVTVTQKFMLPVHENLEEVCKDYEEDLIRGIVSQFITHTDELVASEQFVPQDIKGFMHFVSTRMLRKHLFNFIIQKDAHISSTSTDKPQDAS